MRIAEICPTCATYINAACIIYDGPYLSNIDVSPLDPLDQILGNINDNLVPVTGTVAPTSNATYVGQLYVNTVTEDIYYAVTTGSGSADWVLFSSLFSVPTLQQVLTAGSVATNKTITMNGSAGHQVFISGSGTNSYVRATGTYGSDVVGSTLSAYGLFIENNTTNLELEITPNGSTIYNNGVDTLEIFADDTNYNSNVITYPSGTGYFALSVNGNMADATGNITVAALSGWNLTGNSGTNPLTNFVGTTDAQNLIFKTNNIERMKIDATTGDIYTTYSFRARDSGPTSVQAVSSTTNGGVIIAQDSSFKGYAYFSNGLFGTYVRCNDLTDERTHQLPDADGTYVLSVNGNAPDTAGNVTLSAPSVSLQSVLNYDHSLVNGNNFQGTGAGAGNIGTEVTAIGTNSCINNNDSYVVGIGFSACSNQSGFDVVGIGVNACGGNSGDAIVAVGDLAVNQNTGDNVVGIGFGACSKTGTSPQSGSNVVGIGTYAAGSNSGQNVIALGLNTATNNSGDNVIAIGDGALVGNTGTNVIALGKDAGGVNNTLGSMFVINNNYLPSYLNYAAASAAITPTGKVNNTYLYHDQTTNSIGAVRL